MSKRIELHDSCIDKVELTPGSLRVVFSSLVILNVTDKFGFEFDNTSFSEGVFIIKNPAFESLPIGGYLGDGFLGVEEYCYNLIPVGLSISKACILFLEQDGKSHKIFGDSFEVILSK